MATRFQADTDSDLLKVGMGAILDPSNHAGQTAKLIIDATMKTKPYARRHSLPAQAKATARDLANRILAKQGKENSNG